MDNEEPTVGATEVDSDEEYETVEETLVYVSFPPEFDANHKIFNSDATITLSGFDGPTPKCIIDGYEFSGKYQLSLGTQMLFASPESQSRTVSGSSSSSSECASNEPVLVGLCEKSVKMQLTAVPLPSLKELRDHLETDGDDKVLLSSSRLKKKPRHEEKEKEKEREEGKEEGKEVEREEVEGKEEDDSGAIINHPTASEGVREVL